MRFSIPHAIRTNGASASLDDLCYFYTPCDVDSRTSVPVPRRRIRAIYAFVGTEPESQKVRVLSSWRSRYTQGNDVQMTDELKILLTALVSSFFAVCVTEPARGWFQRRKVRRWLYREMIQNCSVLLGWVESVRRNHQDLDMVKHTAAQFQSEYKRLAFDLAVKDAAFYSLSGEEPYRIEKIFRDFDRVADGSYPDSAECFLRAEIAAASVLVCLKDRTFSKSLAFRVSTKWQKRYFRENLPRIPYVNYQDPPSRIERLFRRGDALQYWFWRALSRLRH